MGLGCSADVDELSLASEGFVVEKLRQRSISWHASCLGWRVKSTGHIEPSWRRRYSQVAEKVFGFHAYFATRSRQ
jgi:hypothetical protein